MVVVAIRYDGDNDNDGVWISNVLVRVGCLCVGLVGREV